MKFVILLAAVIAVTLAAPNKDAVILRSDFDNIGIDGYKFGFESSDGIVKDEEGSLKTIGENEAVVVRGSYTYQDDKGVTHTVNYVADENGFQPVSADIPV